ncbi:MAG TPA: hypothetical protein VH206_07640 [Xanthobacteraceae bacterium]|jgi:hypothetical protein|nr:hypothetical protein [Xanthobacteraceae bacterium]
MKQNDSKREAAEAVLLMPWYAVGTLNDGDRRRVETVLKQYPSLADQVDLTREELDETIHLNESLGAPSSRVADRLMAAIDAEPRAARFKVSSAAANWFTSFFAGLSPRTLAAGASIAVLVIAVQGAMLADEFVKPSQSAPTATTPPAASGQISGQVSGTVPGPVYRGLESGSFVRLRFARDANAGAITAFLQSYRAAVVDGPSSNGLYRVQVAPAKLSRADVGDIVERMRQDHTVDFVDAD